jgi:hypothetical protein
VVALKKDWISLSLVLLLAAGEFSCEESCGAFRLLDRVEDLRADEGEPMGFVGETEITLPPLEFARAKAACMLPLGVLGVAIGASSSSEERTTVVFLSFLGMAG